MKLYTADAIKEQLHKLICQDCEESDVCSICDYRELIDEILDASTVEAEPVKYGHWTNISISVTGSSSAECSLCGTVVHDNFADINRINYCPNCGASMEDVCE